MTSTKAAWGSVATALHWGAAIAIAILVLIGTGCRAGFSEEAAGKAAALRDGGSCEPGWIDDRTDRFRMS